MASAGLVDGLALQPRAGRSARIAVGVGLEQETGRGLGAVIERAGLLGLGVAGVGVQHLGVVGRRQPVGPHFHLVGEPRRRALAQCGVREPDGRQAGHAQAVEEFERLAAERFARHAHRVVAGRQQVQIGQGRRTLIEGRSLALVALELVALHAGVEAEEEVVDQLAVEIQLHAGGADLVLLLGPQMDLDLGGSRVR